MFRTLSAAAFGLALSSALVMAHGYTLGDIAIGHPWARATPPGAQVGGGYVKLTNSGSTPDRLLSGTSEVAGRVEIHEMSVVDGVMRMREMPKGVEIAPGATVEFKPGGYHLMFMELKRPLAAGESVKGSLTFEKAGTIAVEFKVEAIGAMPAGHADMGAGAGDPKAHMGH
ncbi:copper chaperone PCu(A)C [Prosthecomicrobium sp. N25]|uniref:copper chaperone PCu(A)C n=1 Tax=Prosthecomicrobium sp. N25 TaxID=3129254 RepID=UPI0030788D38